EWQSYYGQDNIITYKIDYSGSHAMGFEQNSMVVVNGIYNTLNKALFYNFSCGAVDVVCHSMGGILARLYMQSDDIFEDNIHTLTTINTPNAGTQAADLLRSPWGWGVSLALASNGMPVGQGAVDDLQSRSI